MKVFRKIICLLYLVSISLCGTFYISSSFADNAEGFIPEDLVSDSFSLGYHQTVWEKRKTNYNINLGFDYTANNNLSFISFYTMFNYKFSKSIYSSILLGIDFFDHEYSLNNNEIYHPDSKGGSMYGLRMSYIFKKKFPVSLEYKVYNASEAQSDEWVDLVYEKVSFSLGYKF